MLDAVYINTKRTKPAIIIKSKPPFRSEVQVVAQRKGSNILILNGLEDLPSSPLIFLVEAGGSRTTLETQFLMFE